MQVTDQRGPTARILCCSTEAKSRAMVMPKAGPIFKVQFGKIMFVNGPVLGQQHGCSSLKTKLCRAAARLGHNKLNATHIYKLYIKNVKIYENKIIAEQGT